MLRPEYLDYVGEELVVLFAVATETVVMSKHLKDLSSKRNYR